MSTEYDAEYNVDPDVSVEVALQPLKEAMADAKTTEICVNRPGEIYIEQSSVWKRFDAPDVTFATLNSLAVAVAKRTHGQDISSNRPILSGILPRGERIQIVIPPACEDKTISVTIRKPSSVWFSLADFVTAGFFAHVQPLTTELTLEERDLCALKDKGDYAAFLSRAVQCGKNIVIAGETGSGKTTFMKALVGEIPKSQRLITIEDVRELYLRDHPNRVHLLYPAGAKEGEPVTATTLLKSCMRMKPDRILLAELRGGETYDFLNVAASGHSGSITSCHAGSCALTFERLAFMMQQNPQGRELPYAVIRRLLYLLVDVVVHVHNDTEHGRGRHITEIWYEPMRKRASAAE